MYMHSDKRSYPRTRFAQCAGMSLVEVIVAAAIISLVFGGLMASFQLMVHLIGKSKAEAGALALANERLEYIRSLPYDDVGTVSGIPEGLIPQHATTTLNGIVYNERILIEYVDDPSDGEGADDENGILADYKRVKVEYSWVERSGSDSLVLISNIVPPGIETTAGGGSIRVNVFDASVGPVANASVRLYNDTGTSTIDITRYTNSEGVALISGAPALSFYEITATKDGFSTDQTYSASSTNPNPITPHIAVLESQVSTMNFQIDALADLTIRTIGEPTIERFTDSFDDAAGVAEASNTVFGSGRIVLAGGLPYVSSGSVLSDTITPSVISAWDTFSFTTEVSADTNVRVQLYSVSGTSTSLVPDSLVPGNSTGFATGTISLISVDPTTYPSLALGATLETSNASSTPALLDWELAYTVNEPPVGSVPVLVTGSKTIGTNASSSSIYKLQSTYTTDSGGEVTASDIEWDTYTMTLGTSAYDIKEVCENIPYTLSPAASETVTLTLVPSSTNALRIRVEDTSGVAVAGAAVNLMRTGFSDSGTSSACGQTFFNSGLTVASDYDVVVSASGYISETVEDVSIDGYGTLVVVLTSV